MIPLLVSFRTVVVLGLAAITCCAQIVTPRSRVAAVYQKDNLESQIVAEVEPNGRWRLDFNGAEFPVRLYDGTVLANAKFMLPARDNGISLLARVKGPGKGNDGWVDPQNIEISPDPAWKIPADTLLFVPLKTRQVPPLRSAPPLEAPRGGKALSFLLLIAPEGKVAAVRALESPLPPLETELQKLRFAPVRMEGEPVHVLLAVKVEPTR